MPVKRGKRKSERQVSPYSAHIKVGLTCTVGSLWTSSASETELNSTSTLTFLIRLLLSFLINPCVYGIFNLLPPVSRCFFFLKKKILTQLGQHSDQPFLFLLPTLWAPVFFCLVSLDDELDSNSNFSLYFKWLWPQALETWEDLGQPMRKVGRQLSVCQPGKRFSDSRGKARALQWFSFTIPDSGTFCLKPHVRLAYTDSFQNIYFSMATPCQQNKNKIKISTGWFRILMGIFYQ